MSDETAASAEGAEAAEATTDSTSTNGTENPALSAPDMPTGDAPAQSTNTTPATAAAQFETPRGTEYTFQKPRGVEMTDEHFNGVAGLVAPLAGKLSLSDEQSQGLFDGVNNMISQAQERSELAAKAEQQAIENAMFNKHGQEGVKTLYANASTAINQMFGGKAGEFIELAQKMGIQNNPEFIQFLASNAKEAAPEEPNPSGAGASKPQTLAEAMQGTDAEWQAFLNQRKQ